MTKSELVETLDNLIIESFKQRESVDFGRFPDQYGVFDGKIFAYQLVRDLLFYIHLTDDMETLDPYEIVEKINGNKITPEVSTSPRLSSV